MILHHHEAFDGNGYPFGLRGEEIPLGARIIAVADTLSALLQDRPYRPGVDLESAMAEIHRCSGTQFDPKVVGALESLKNQIAQLLAPKAGLIQE